MRSTATLLKRGGNPKDHKELAQAMNIEEAKILKWVNHADLFWVSGIGSEYSDLLEPPVWIRCLNSGSGMR